MRLLTTGALLMATATLGLGAAPSAEAATASSPERAAGFTPPIGTDKGSVRAGDRAERPNGYEMDLGWTVR